MLTSFVKSDLNSARRITLLALGSQIIQILVYSSKWTITDEQETRQEFRVLSVKRHDIVCKFLNSLDVIIL